MDDFQLKTRQLVQKALLKVSSDHVSQGNKRSQQSRVRLIRGLENGLLVVALGLRYSYLVDTISLEVEECKALAESLHKVGLTSLLVLHESMTSQVFLINTQLLKERLDRDTHRPGSNENVIGASDLESMIWVDVRYGRPITKVFVPPSYILKALQSLKSVLNKAGHPARFLDLRLVAKAEEMPPIAAWLLEYPVGYCLVVEENSFGSGMGSGIREDGVGDGFREGEIDSEVGGGRTNLGGEKLILVEVVLKTEDVRVGSGNDEKKADYTLLSFTYPSFLTSSSPILKILKQSLSSRYQSRLSLVSDTALVTAENNRSNTSDISTRGWTRVEVIEREVIVEGVSL